MLNENQEHYFALNCSTNSGFMKKVIVELIATMFIGGWVICSQSIYLTAQIIPSWHTTIWPDYFINLKLLFLVMTILFFAYRIFNLSRILIQAKR